MNEKRTHVASVPYFGGMSTKTIELEPHEELCSDCRGSGQVRIRFGVDIGSRDYAHCETCDGNGKVKAVPRAIVKLKFYVASSWRNNIQPEVVAALSECGHEVYDFKNPREGDNGFHRSEVDGGWETWTPRKYVECLAHPIANAGFNSDMDAMRWADACVLVLPCGRSAHLEAGWFVGAKKPLHILLDSDKFVPELMYKMATSITCSLGECLVATGSCEMPK